MAEILLSQYTMKVFISPNDTDELFLEGEQAGDLEADAAYEAAEKLKDIWEKHSPLKVRVTISDPDGEELWSSEEPTNA